MRHITIRIPLFMICIVIFYVSTSFGITNTISLSDDERQVEVTTDKLFYVQGETVNITMTNIGNMSVAGSPFLDIYYITSGYYNKIFEAYPPELVPQLWLNEHFTFLWNQTMRNGSQVPQGRYEIREGFQTCGGILADDAATFYIQNPPKIEKIIGGFGVTATIYNPGNGDLADIPWSFDSTGFLFSGNNIEGTISINAWETATLNIFIFGFGPTNILLKIVEETKESNAFLFGPFVYL